MKHNLALKHMLNNEVFTDKHPWFGICDKSCCFILVCKNYKWSIYMVFEYMDHDLTGLADKPGMRFTIPQIKVKPSISV